MSAQTLQPPVLELTAIDRCDRCGAQAYVRASFMAADLLFCAHHWREHRDKLREVAVDLRDETGKLEGNKPSISANAE